MDIGITPRPEVAEDAAAGGQWAQVFADEPKPTPVTRRPQEPEKKSAAAVLVDLALERYRFGVTLEGDPFGVPLAGGHVVRMLRGSRTSLRAELASAYRRQTRKIASQQALADALLVLEGEAQDAKPEAVHLRVAEHEGVIWLDLGDTAESVVRIAGGTWSVTSHAPVLFRRTVLTGSLPMPEAGDIAELWELVNVAPEDRPLVLGWLVAAIATPGVPHPILSLFGEQGTGKSFASRMLVDLVDPSPVPLRKPPKDPDSWVTAASGSWVVGLDNLSTVSQWLSDTLCRAVTGDGDVRRQLYTDSGLAVFSFRRVILLNGIDLGGLPGDLAERLLVVDLDPIAEKRLPERALKKAWAEAWPRLFGGLLDVVCGFAGNAGNDSGTTKDEHAGQRVKTGANPSVRLGSTLRMADFAQLLETLDAGTGTGLARYLDKTRAMSADSLAAVPFIVAMMHTLSTDFHGTAAELLEAVGTDDRPRDWPGARAVTTLLKRNAPALRKLGWTVEDLGPNRDGITNWRVSRPQLYGKSSPHSPQTRRTTCRACSEPLDDVDGIGLHPGCSEPGEVAGVWGGVDRNGNRPGRRR